MHDVDQVPVLSDDVVTLDVHSEADIASHLAGEDQETARRFGWWPNRSTEASVRKAFGDWAIDWQDGRPRRTFAVRGANDLHLVGGCELRIQPDGATGHVSYWTNARERRRGYATHALRLLANYARTIGLRQLESHVAADNAASRTVCERAKFMEVGRFIEANGDDMVRYVLPLNAATDNA